MAESEAEKQKDFLALLRDVSLICGVYLYFIGWTYEFYFFSHFGISLSALEIPVYYFIVYAFSALTYYTTPRFLTSLPVVAGTIITIVLIVVYANSPDEHRAGIRSLIAGILVLALLSIFPILFLMARHVGEVRAKEIRLGRYASKTVRFIFKQNPRNNYPSELTEANASGALKLLAHTKDTYFVFNQVPNAKPESAAVPFGYAYHVAKTDADLITVEMRGFSKSEVSGNE